MPVRSLPSALLHGKCPRCREGDLFTYPLSRVSKFNTMNPVCPHCGVMLQPEPGFYQGAMHVGYGFTMMIIVVIRIILFLAGNRSEWVYIGAIVGVMALLAPLNYRYSRIVCLYLFGGITFDPSFRQPSSMGKAGSQVLEGK